MVIPYFHPATAIYVGEVNVTVFSFQKRGVRLCVKTGLDF